MRHFRSFLALALLATLTLCGMTSTAHAQTTVNQIFSFTGNSQSFIVPDSVTNLFVRLWGAAGGNVYGGGGAFVSGNLSVTPGDVLTLLVGSGGGDNGGNSGGTGVSGTSGIGGGGNGGSRSTGGFGGGAGGGRSAILLSGAELVDAGGGGGGGSSVGGAGGVAAGSPGGGIGVGGKPSGGLGGTQMMGGMGGVAGDASGAAGKNGAQLMGGIGGNSGSGLFGGGGGGGGYYGGGGAGAGGGGGGGSSYTTNAMFMLTHGEDGNGTTPGGTSDLFYVLGVGAGSTQFGSGGNGEIVLSYALPPGNYRLAWQNQTTGDTLQWLMSDAVQVSTSEILSGVASAWKMVGTADFNGDGNKDLLFQNTSTGEIGYWQMSGAMFVKYVQIAAPGLTPTVWHIVGAGNLNGGAQPNILFQNASTGEIGYWILANGHESSYVQLMPPGSVPLSYQIVGVPDFTGTGKANILFQNTSTGEIGYWTLKTGKYQSYTQISAPGVVSTVWHIAATPDINGDGQSDLLFQNVSTGEIGCWLMKNGQHVGTNYTQILAPGIISTAWRIGGVF